MNKHNAVHYLPLVQALVDGKTIQYLRQEGWHDEAYVSFMSPPSEYRIKPQVAKYRRYLARYSKDVFASAETTDAIRVLTLNYSKHDTGLLDFIQQQAYFIKWIDKDWIEYELD